MSDEDKNKPLSVDLDALMAADGAEVSASMDPALKEIEGYREQLNGPMGDLRKVMEDQQNLLRSLRSPYDNILRGESELKKTIDGLSKSPFHDLHQQARNSMLGHLEVKTIEAPRMPPMPKNPILETNKRLGQLETHFSQMLHVMTNAAEIGTAIQGHANEFLTKFEKASEDTDKSARKAIWIGVIAIFIAILTPLIQIAYDANQDHTETKLDRLASEVEKLRETDAQSSERLLEALRRGDDVSERLVNQLKMDGEANREILGKIEKILAEPKAVPKLPAK